MEETLIVRLKGGDYTAFDELYRLYSKRLYAYCIQFCKSEDESKEIVQDTFVKLWEYREHIDSCSTLCPLLFSMAKNKLINAYKKRLNSPVYEDYVIYQDSLKNCDCMPMEFDEFLKNIEQAIGKLSPTQQKIIRLSRFENLSNTEIAHCTGLSEQTVKNQLSLGLKRLKLLLDAFFFILLVLSMLN